MHLPDRLSSKLSIWPQISFLTFKKYFSNQTICHISIGIVSNTFSRPYLTRNLKD